MLASQRASRLWMISSSSRSTTRTGTIVPASIRRGVGVGAEASFFFLAMWGLLVVTLIVVMAAERSRLGFGLACIRQNEPAAAMIGIHATLYKSPAFPLPGLFVAMAADKKIQF